MKPIRNVCRDGERGMDGLAGGDEAAELLCVRARAFTLTARMPSRVLSAHVTYSGDLQRFEYHTGEKNA